MTANLYEVIRAPRVSEKTARLQEVSNQYAFEVATDATKADIKEAIEKIFDVKVVTVHTMTMKGKQRRWGRTPYKTRNWKKAIVTLAEGNTIEGFSGA